jgi:hypothetical protein
MTLKRLGIPAGAAIVVWIAIILALHFGQIHHDHLGFDVDTAFPPNQPFMPGEIYATTLAEIVDHELHTGFGWRPNDFFLWGPWMMADNNANRQIGIIMAVRESTRVFKDDLTKISSNEYDPNLVIADTDFRNDAEKWILPSAESKYADGVAHLRLYVAGLHANPETSRELNQRNVELVTLFEAWTDLLGDAHAMLYMQQNSDGSPIRAWQDDNYFYHAQGYAHVMYCLMLAIKREYHQSQTIKPVIGQLFDETIIPLHDAAMLKPLIVLNGSPSGIFANHRRNLDSYISEARQKMFSIRDELAH